MLQMEKKKNGILLAVRISSLSNQTLCVKAKALFTLSMKGAYGEKKKKPHLVLYLHKNYNADGDEK
jgi:hypothetical protein